MASSCLSHLLLLSYISIANYISSLLSASALLLLLEHGVSTPQTHAQHCAQRAYRREDDKTTPLLRAAWRVGVLVSYALFARQSMASAL